MTRVLVPILLGILALLVFGKHAGVAAAKANFTGMVYPIYVYPTQTAITKDYSVIANASNSVTGWVILDPNNGDSNSCPPNSDWTAALNVLTTTLNIGYVHSSYGNRTKSILETEIDNYVKCWNVNGIFIDEASTNESTLSYYLSLYNYIKAQDKDLNVWINPGTNTPAGFLTASDVIVIFEDTYSAWQQYTPSSYVTSGENSPYRFAAIVNDVPSQTVMQGIFDQMNSWNIGWGIVYFNGDSYTSGLPKYYSSEIIYVYDHFRKI